MPFVKLDCGMLNSSIWPDRCAREVFVTALLMSTPAEFPEGAKQLEVDSLMETGWAAPPGWYGLVNAAGTGIVRMAGIEKNEGMEALRRLCSPEPESRSQDFEGRRMIRIDGGYIVLNFIKYRDKDATAADRARRWRQRNASRRISHADTRIATPKVGVDTRSVTPNDTIAEYRVQSTESTTPPTPSSKFTIPTLDEVRGEFSKCEDMVSTGVVNAEAELFIAHYTSNGWKVGRNPMKCWKAAVAGWRGRWSEKRGTGALTPAAELRVLESELKAIGGRDPRDMKPDELSRYRFLLNRIPTLRKLISPTPPTA